MNDLEMWLAERPTWSSTLTGDLKYDDPITGLRVWLVEGGRVYIEHRDSQGGWYEATHLYSAEDVIAWMT